MVRNRTLICLLISIPLVLIAGYLKPAPSSSTDRIQASAERFWVLKTHGTAKYDMVLLGDSRTYRGLSPEAMESVLPGYRIFNSGYSSAGLTPVIFEEGNRRLDPKSDKRVIVLGITPATLTPLEAKNEQYLQEKKRPQDYIFSRLYLYPYVIFFQPTTPEELYGAMIDKQIVNDTNYLQEFHDSGWVASWMVPPDPLQALESYRQFFTKTQVSSEIIDGVMNQTNQWTRQGVRVFGFRVPSSIKMEQLENAISGFDEQSFVEQFKNANGIWLEIPHDQYESFDGSHLTKNSAIRFSKTLAGYISQHLNP